MMDNISFLDKLNPQQNKYVLTRGTYYSRRVREVVRQGH